MAGTLKVPSTNVALSAWMRNQCFRKKAGVLSPKQKRLLDRLGFGWDPQHANWIIRYTKLKEFQARHDGHLKVPYNRNKTSSLASWAKL
jgi:hypothetical protein